MKPKFRINKFRVAIVLLVLAVVVLYFLIYVAPQVSNAFVETYVCEFGTVDVDFNSDYLCVRNEKVHTSDAAGTVVRKAKAGNLVRVGNKVVEVNGYAYRSQERGLVSYTYDGLEKKYNSEGIKDLKISALKPKKDDKGNVTYKLKKCAADTVSVGDPVYRIIDSHKWYLVTWVDDETADKLMNYSRVTIEIDDEEKTQLRFRVESVEPPRSDDEDEETEETEETSSDDTSDEGEDEEDEEEPADEQQEEEPSKTEEKPLRQAVFSCDRYYERVGALRYGNARIIFNKVTGIILETSSIVEEDGKKGVYVKNKYNNYVFTPVRIIETVGDLTVVESRTFYDQETDKIISTVRNYDSIKKGDGSGNVDQD